MLDTRPSSDRNRLYVKTNKGETAQKIGRPRQFSNEDVFLAVARVITERGYSALTLPAVAQEMGVTGPALGRRFGSRQSLLLRWLEWAFAMVPAWTATEEKAESSPLQRLRVYLLSPFGTMTETLGWLTNYGNFLAFYVEARSNPEFARMIRAATEARVDHVQSLLEEAAGAGELAVVESGALAMTLLDAVNGAHIAMVLWGPERADATDVRARIDNALDVVLAPLVCVAAANGHR
jgi:AcrR family transcriptional regulator